MAVGVMGLTLGQALESYRLSHDSRYVRIVERYLQDQHGVFSDAALTQHVRHLEGEKLKPATIDIAIRTVRTFARFVNEQAMRQVLVVPKARGWQFDGKVQSQRVAFSVEAVAGMIAAAREGRVSWLAAAHLALGSVYGLRVGEIDWIEPAVVDRAGSRIYLRREKHSQSRWTWLPPEVAAVLPDPWPEHGWVSAAKSIDECWAAASDLPRPERAGWHAMRRSLAVGLRAAGVADGDAVRFLGWKRGGGGALDLLDLYAHPTAEAGLEAVETVRSEPEGRRDEDARAWDLHPFLAHWR